MKREPGLAGSNDYSGQGGKDETHRERFVRAQRDCIRPCSLTFAKSSQYYIQFFHCKGASGGWYFS